MPSLFIREPGSLRIDVRNRVTQRTLCGRDKPRVTTLAAGISCGVCQMDLVRARGALQEMVDFLGPDLVHQLLEESTSG